MYICWLAHMPNGIVEEVKMGIVYWQEVETADRQQQVPGNGKSSYQLSV